MDRENGTYWSDINICNCKYIEPLPQVMFLIIMRWLMFVIFFSKFAITKVENNNQFNILF